MCGYPKKSLPHRIHSPCVAYNGNPAWCHLHWNVSFTWFNPIKAHIPWRLLSKHQPALQTGSEYSSQLHDYSATPSCMSSVSLPPNNSERQPCQPQQVTSMTVTSVYQTTLWSRNAHLVITHHKLSGSMQDPILRKLFWPCNLQRRLVKLFLDLGLFTIFWYHLLPDITWNRMVVDPYFGLLTLLLVRAVMQLDMAMATRIVSGQVCLATPILHNIFLVLSKFSM